MEKKLMSRFTKAFEKDDKLINAYMLIHSEKHGIHLNMAEGSTAGLPAHPEQAYFIASIDKLFTSVLIAMFVEQGRISFDDPIAPYLDADILQDLHIYKGKDYSKEIKIKHLLNHTSGLFGDAATEANQDTSLLDLLLDKPSKPWHPHDIVIWSKKHMKTHFPPGEGFYYSDIGYYLLTLIIEQITSKPYYESIENYFFRPLEMKHTFIIGYTDPLMKSQHPIANCYINNINITQTTRLGMDYAGGRMVANSADLLIFMNALTNHQLLRKETMELMMKDTAKYFIGIDYGYGVMKFKHVPVFMPRRYQVWGHAGSTGSFMFYHPDMETYFIGSLNHFGYHRKGIMLMFKMIDKLSKELK